MPALSSSAPIGPRHGLRLARRGELGAFGLDGALGRSRDRAGDDAAAEDARLPFGAVEEHTSLAGRYAVFTGDQFDFDTAAGTGAQPSRLWRPGRANLD